MPKRNILLLIPVFILSLMFIISCDDDNSYPAGDFYVELATVHPTGGNDYYLVLDNGDKLWVSVSDYYYKPRENQRVMVDYTLLSGEYDDYDHLIKVNYIADILTKEVIGLTTENVKEIGDDPIKILRMWVGDNYLNIEFGYNRGGQKSHFINLVNNKLPKDDSDEIVLEFRHNAYDDPQLYGGKGLVAFNFRPFIVENKDSVNFIIKVKGYDEVVKEYPITYKFNEREKTVGDFQQEYYDSDVTQYK